MKKWSIFLLSALLFASCKHDQEELNKVNPDNSSELNAGDSLKLKPKVYDEDIEVIFQNNKKDTPLEDSLLSVVKLCDPKQKDLNNYSRPACDAKFFDVFPINQKTSIRQDFLVVCRSGVGNFPVRRVIVFTKEGDEYTNMNSFVADLIGMEKSKTSPYNDLILQFMDEDENRFECSYVYADGKYHYSKVMKINGNRIKKQYLDSMKVVIGREISRMKLSY